MNRSAIDPTLDNDPASQIALTLNEKMSLLDGIRNLPAHSIGGALEIINNALPSPIRCANAHEVSLNALDTKTMRKLMKYIEVNQQAPATSIVRTTLHRPTTISGRDAVPTAVSVSGPVSVSGKKRPFPSEASSSAAASAVAVKATKVLKTKKESAHVLLWICSAGKGGRGGRVWKQKALRVLGVYASKEAAEQKKREVMSRHECGGNGDICVGGTWEDEIDLVVRAVEEVQL